MKHQQFLVMQDAYIYRSENYKSAQQFRRCDAPGGLATQPPSAPHHHFAKTSNLSMELTAVLLALDCEPHPQPLTDNAIRGEGRLAVSHQATLPRSNDCLTARQSLYLRCRFHLWKRSRHGTLRDTDLAGCKEVSRHDLSPVNGQSR